jgi:hypothetical protein
MPGAKSIHTNQGCLDPFVSTGTTIQGQSLNLLVKLCETSKPPQHAVNLCLQSVHNFTPLLVLTCQQTLRFLLRKRVKVEITDEEGTTYSLALQGKVSHDKVMRMMELIDLLGQGGHSSAGLSLPDESTTYGKLLKLIQSSYSAKEFSSADIARDYEDLHAAAIPLSTVSTYLSRLADRGLLRRQKFGNSWVYRLVHLSDNQLAT